jgi:hypothetical protein
VKIATAALPLADLEDFHRVRSDRALSPGAIKDGVNNSKRRKRQAAS